MAEVTGQEHRKGAQGMGAQPHSVMEDNPSLLPNTPGGTTGADKGSFSRIMEPFGLEKPSKITESHCSSTSPGTTSTRVLNPARDGNSTTALGRRCQGWTALSKKEFSQHTT